MSFTAEIDVLAGRLHSGEVTREGFVGDCARLACHAVGCSRAGLWVFSKSSRGHALHCLAMYDRGSDRLVQVDDRVQADSDAYFETLQTLGSVVAEDARRHPATRDFFSNGLQPHGVVSLMSAAFSLNGELFGAFTCSQVIAPAQWTQRQLSILTRIGSRATLALASVSQNKLDTFLGDI